MDRERRDGSDPANAPPAPLPLCGYQVADLTIDLRQARVLRNGKEIQLAVLSYDLLMVLVRESPRTLSVATLIDRVWAGLVVGPETVSQRVRLLRASLGDDATCPRYIASVRGRGYRLAAAVTELSVLDAPSTQARPRNSGASVSGLWFRPSVAAAALALVAGLMWFVIGSRPGTPSSDATLQKETDAAPALEPTTSPTQDAQAYDYYLKGLVARKSAALLSASSGSVRAFEDAVSLAIVRDPGFAAAYAERAAAHIGALATNAGDAETHVEQARRDIEAAERLAPQDAKVLAARALYLTHVEHDYPAAWAAFQAASAAGLSDPVWIKSSAWAAWGLGRLDEALRIFERSVALDPGNSSLILRYAFLLEINRRPLDALRALDFGIAQNPDELLVHSRASVLYAWTGNIDELNAVVTRYRPQALAKLDGGVMLVTDVWHARQNGRFDEMKRLVDAAPQRVIRSTHYAAGMQPVARLRGWANLLLGDRQAAAADGREILEFLRQHPGNRWNLHFHRLLAAEAYTFMGEPVRATALAREALSAAPPYRSLELDLDVGAVYAWNGNHDDALQLIGRLTQGLPAVGPAMFVRDPLYRIPLADNADYRLLAKRLESAMEATKL